MQATDATIGTAIDKSFDATADAAWQRLHEPWKLSVGTGPVVATAIHAGHDVRPALERYMAVSAQDRRREEDPLTGFFTCVGDSAVTAFRSRFEFDLNRQRDAAIATDPAAAWGLRIWKKLPPPTLLDQSLWLYDAFYAAIAALIDHLTRTHQHILVLDLHSYNHRRDGRHAATAPEDGNPDVNIGTGTMQDRSRWSKLVDRFGNTLRESQVNGRTLDVRENIRFRGGHFPAWLHARYPQQVCTLSIECKKIFMDEWTAEANIAALDDLRLALLRATAAVRPLLSASPAPRARGTAARAVAAQKALAQQRSDA